MDSQPASSKTYVPLAVYSHYSLQKAFSKPEQLAEACVRNGIKQMALTDINSVSGVITTYKALKDKGIKLIYGMHWIAAGYNLILLCRNKAGWRELLEVGNLSSPAALGKYNNLTAILNLNLCGRLSCEDLLAKSNDVKSHFPNFIFGFTNRISCEDLIGCVEGWGDKLIPISDVYYAKPQDSNKLKILLCSLFKTTLKDYSKVLDSNSMRFFSKDSFHLKSFDEMLKDGFTQSELENTIPVGNAHETFSLAAPPALPKFADDEKEELRKVCRVGWKKLIQPKFPNKDGDYHKYVDRIKYELDIIEEVGFCGYFLIVQDYVNAARKRGDMIGFARGSGGGCLVSYLIGNIKTDPVKYDLPFTRFINKGRLSKDNFSFPDLDIDFPRATRGKTIEYIRNKYGGDKVCQIVTFSSLQGRSALREVLRVKGELDQGEINAITEHIPDKAFLSDVLEEIRREGGVPSIVKWALEHKGEYFTDWCRIADDGSLEGDLAEDFAIAIELEGTYKSYSKHASGVVVSPVPLDQLCILWPDKNNFDQKIASFEMKQLEAIGLVKLDILGTAVLDKMMLCKKLIEDGDDEDVEVEIEADDSEEE